MTVARILETKGAYASTVRPTDTIERALDLLANDDVGALVVATDEQRIYGIVSERDIVRALTSHGAKTLDMRVADVMTPDPFTCTAQDRVDDVLTTMDRCRFRHAPVIANGKLAGIVSLQDIVKLKLDEVRSEAAAIRSYIAA